ncbi:MAG: DUF1080 domain-containing protein [Bacteroidales bacterium]|jgi:hypothetical protein|nr:DUF1080 domain-containing protein [Bacteroidales bacterium]
MKQKIILFSIILFAGLFLAACKQTDNKLTTQEAEEGWKLLFDGKTMNGWRDFNREGITATWEVDRGALSGQGLGSDSTGYIVTKDQYENFILSFDWKIAEGGNSGVLYHVLERPGYNVPYISGPEYQVIDDLGFPDKLEEWQKVGADYAMYVPERKIVKKAGQWNNSKIVFDNGHVEHWLNGEKIIEFEAWSDDWFARKSSGKWENAPEYGLARKGYICLQDHGSRSWFKNIKLKELPRKPKEEVLFNGTDLTGWEAYGTELWYVDNGDLVCESGPNKQYGYLGTRKYYNDFDLNLEFKLISNGNSGVFIRSYIRKDVEISGWQVEVAPPGHDTGGIYESYGRGWIAQIPDEKENILKKDDWNKLRIKVSGDVVTTWLNGEQMTDLKDEKIGQGQGRILLQIHDGGGIKVRWRNIKVTEL